MRASTSKAHGDALVIFSTAVARVPQAPTSDGLPRSARPCIWGSFMTTHCGKAGTTSLVTIATTWLRAPFMRPKWTVRESQRFLTISITGAPMPKCTRERSCENSSDGRLAALSLLWVASKTSSGPSASRASLAPPRLAAFAC